MFRIMTKKTTEAGEKSPFKQRKYKPKKRNNLLSPP